MLLNWNFSLPELRPDVYQKPYPPIIRACSSVGSTLEMARAGRPFMMNIQDDETTIDRFSQFRNVMAESGYDEERIEQTVEKIMYKLTNENLNYIISYQSRVGPLKWIGPSTDEVIIKYSKEKKGIVIVPIAFVSEHSETLVELDIEYKKLAEKNGCGFYKRVPALGIEENFIKGLTELVLQQKTRGNFVSSIMCPNKYVKCPCQ